MYRFDEDASTPIVLSTPDRAKVEDAPDPPDSGIFVSLRKVTEGEAVVVYREPSATKEIGYHRLSRRANKTDIKLQNSYLDAGKDIMIFIGFACALLGLITPKHISNQFQINKNQPFR